MSTISVARKSLAGKVAFEVPVVRKSWGNQPRTPQHIAFSAFYTPNSERCMLICTGPSAQYMFQRRYARYMGRVIYVPSAKIAQGLSHTIEWPEEDEDE